MMEGRAQAEGLTLTVAAMPESLAVVRQALAGFAEGMGFDEDAIASLKTIVTEACMNAIVHAYPNDDSGPIDVAAYPRPDGLEVTVSDHGEGFQPRPADPDEPSMRIGLPLIAALSDGFEIRGGPGDGTELRMRLNFEPTNGTVEDTGPARETVGTVLTIPPGEQARPVLSRVIGALATRLDFSIDQLSDTVLLGDAVVAHDASDFLNRMVGIELLDGDGRLDFRIGPLVEGGSERILESLEIPGVGSLRQLATDVKVTRAPSRSTDQRDAEYLLVVIDPRA
jgi:anti-sigma regulatory factor (Ser/Thr protein kinase)